MLSHKTSVRLMAILVCLCACRVLRVQSQPPLPGTEAQLLQDLGLGFYQNADIIQSQYISSLRFRRSILSRYWPFILFFYFLILLPRSSSSSSSGTTETCPQAPNADLFGLPCCASFADVGTCPGAPCTFTTSCVYDCSDSALLNNQAACEATNQCTFSALLMICT